MEVPLQDSVTWGTGAKGALKIYLDLKNMSDDEVEQLVKRGAKVYQLIKAIGM